VWQLKSHYTEEFAAAEAFGLTLIPAALPTAAACHFPKKISEFLSSPAGRDSYSYRHTHSRGQAGERS
jgi:hypothetical protein